ncbi:phosphoglycerate dehydrogenase [Mesosutterella sp. AGMB02718]|uniref:Phosphoglycerate dehydrogenase n=1 Tax=Mesosutterella faecium TaxID=2925194 RepID=A0ABT7IJ25_9BURK|nr:phosphoglycerate dehydrogenase [Mesosutterella sp. AGMB02718]MDL2058388.1 phosphoglycerate dehydrogenase [Mesosutterella sp. AGMB02718]
MKKLVITSGGFAKADPQLFSELERAGYEVQNLSGRFQPNSPEDDIIGALEGARSVIAGRESYSRRVLSALPELRLISRCGVGCDSIDLEACRELGITVCRGVGSVEGAVAEQVMAYILFFARRVDLQSSMMHGGIWKKVLARGAKGSTLGLVGFGGIGREIALRAKPFGMKILYFCRHPDPRWDEAYGVSYAPLQEVIARSDYLSVNTPLTPETRGMFGAKEFAAMKQGAVFINIARGPVADARALAAALKSGHLGGAGIDVYDSEPCTDSPLRECENAVLTPHSSTFTGETRLLMARAAAQNVLDWERGALSPRARAV